MTNVAIVLGSAGPGLGHGFAAGGFMEWLYLGAYWVLGVSIVVTMVRLVLGPTLADRVVALDLMSFFAAGVIAISSVYSGRNELLIVAIVLALLTFMGTVAFAMYLHRKARASSGARVTRTGEVVPPDESGGVL